MVIPSVFLKKFFTLFLQLSLGCSLIPSVIMLSYILHCLTSVMLFLECLFVGIASGEDFLVDPSCFLVTHHQFAVVMHIVHLGMFVIYFLFQICCCIVKCGIKIVYTVILFFYFFLQIIYLYKQFFHFFKLSSLTDVILFYFLKSDSPLWSDTGILGLKV